MYTNMYPKMMLCFVIMLGVAFCVSQTAQASLTGLEGPRMVRAFLCKIKVSNTQMQGFLWLKPWIGQLG